MKGAVTSDASRYSESIRKAVRALSEPLGREEQCWQSEVLLPSRHSNSAFAPARKDIELAAWGIVSMWLTGVVTKRLHTKATLREAEEWFVGGRGHSRSTSLLSAKQLCEAERFLPRAMDLSVCKELLPYLLDPYGPGSRRSVRRDPTTSRARAQKRADGAFYTPADIAEYMVKGCLDCFEDCDAPVVYDPACGTGVFLRAALRELLRRQTEASASTLARERIYGTDIALWPLHASAFVLLADILIYGEGEQTRPIDQWRRLGLNLGCVDALLVDPIKNEADNCEKSSVGDDRVSLSDLFPAIEDAPTVIVGNPPYADVGERSDQRNLEQTFKTLEAKPQPNAQVYVAFIEQMIRLANKDKCAASLVLPISIASSIGPQFVAARSLIQQTMGRWRFAFFDREPQALFGEDVKTRNAIVFWDKDVLSTKPVIASGPLRRWRGESRSTLFQRIEFTPIPSEITAGIPRVEGLQQASALATLNARWHRLKHAVCGIGRYRLADTTLAANNIVFVGPTAYNFINVFLSPPPRVLESERQLSESQLHAVMCATSKVAFAVFAILTSNLAYWWWHTHGDGFHVLKRFIAHFPYGNDMLDQPHIDLLSGSGTRLWSAMKSNPTLSLNRGRTSLAYNSNWYTDMRRSADKVLIDIAGLSGNFVDELQQFTEYTVAARLRNNTAPESLE